MRIFQCALHRAALYTLAGLFIAFTFPAFAQTYNLTIAHTPVNITGTPTTALTINGQLPAPTLHWREGETVVIHVTNRLNVPTSIHWHGILLPAAMDGVPGISFDGIAPGETFTYRFTLHQSGTYWYHSHSGGQQQKGLRGAIVIAPKTPPPYRYDKSYVIMLTDWTDESPHAIMANLKSQSDYYNYAQRTVGDFFHDVATQGWDATIADRLMWGRMRMSPTDIADVTGATYTYLMNGKTATENWTALYQPGNKVLLRFINGSAMTYFDVRIPGLEMTVVAVDGQNVKPVTVDEIRMSVASTYDVFVTPKGDSAYTIFAESMDRSGYTRGTLAPRTGMTAPVPPMDPRPVLTMRAMGMKMHAMQTMNMSETGMHQHGASDVARRTPHPNPLPKGEGERHAGMAMPAATQARPEKMHMPGMSMSGMTMPKQSAHYNPNFDPPLETGPGVAHIAPAPRSRLADPGVGLRNNGRKVLTYADLASLEAHPNPPPEWAIVLHLTGNMERYMWSFNGKKYGASVPLKLHYGERVRIVLINDTMMAHPIHLHGMYMELQNGHDVHNPLLHTVNVKPGGKLSLLVTADAPGGWALHCHMQYHMEAGMFRQVQVAPPPGSSGAAIYSTPAFDDRDKPEAPPPPHAETTLDDSAWYHRLVFDRLEYQYGNHGDNALAWEIEGWLGGDINKLWLKSEGERAQPGGLEHAGVQLLYGRAIAPFWDLQAGLRHDFHPESPLESAPSRSYAAFDVDGLAPYWFEVEATAFLSDQGKLGARFEATYELLFTQRLILEPRLELNFAFQDQSELGLARGVTDMAVGLRLRYEFTRKFAPYVGISWQSWTGATAGIARRAGAPVSELYFVAGLRFWFN